MSETVFDVDTDTHLSDDTGEHDRFAHYVEKGSATRALIYGEPVVALCGKIWVPSRDPEKYPVCPTCKDLYSLMSRGED